jgi:hypothetical protein
MELRRHNPSRRPSSTCPISSGSDSHHKRSHSPTIMFGTCDEPDCTKENKKKRTIRQLGMCCVRCILALCFLLRGVLYLRVLLMQRPSLFYGNPMDQDTVQACLSENSTRHIKSEHHVPIWDWHTYTQNETLAPKHKLLIAQYSGFGSYSKLLELVVPVNRAYAKKWGHDVLIVQGTTLQLPGVLVNKECPSETRATFDKIAILQKALQRKDIYDQVLILDTDTSIVDFDTDITTLVPMDKDHMDQSFMLAAHRVHKYDIRTTWDVNAGITLWNLHHPDTQTVANNWLASVESNPAQVLLTNDDQFFLQKTLLDQANRKVWSLAEEFNYYEATVVKHFKREKRSWSDTGLISRHEQIQGEIDGVCQKWTCGEEALPEYSKRQPKYEQ